MPASTIGGCRTCDVFSSGAALPLGTDPERFRPGDLVTWTLPGNLPHIGIVSRRRSATGTPLIVHNIGAGPALEDVLFAYEMTGHYRFPPPRPGGAVR